MAQDDWIILAKFFLDSGTEYFSAQNIRHPNYLYEGRALRWGFIEKSIPNPVGPPEISHARIKLTDKDRKWRDLLYAQTARRRLIELKILRAGESESGTSPFFTGEVIDYLFTADFGIEIELRDRTSAWLDEEIPATVIRDLYSYVDRKDEGGVIPIIAGSMRTEFQSPPGPLGQIPCPHMGIVGSPFEADRFGVALHPVTSIVAVYRRELLTVEDSTAGEWVLVPSAEYRITTETFTAFNIELNPTYIDFSEPQPDNTEIRADVDGINFRGPWGTLSDTNVEGAPIPLKNPIDFFINVTFFLLHKAGISEDVWDTTEICALRELFRVGYGSPPTIPECDGAIVQKCTGQEFLAWFLTSFNLDLLQKSNGKLTLRFIYQSNPARYLITEGRLILKETFQEFSPDPTINQTIYLFEENPAEQTWQTWGVLENTTDQMTLGFDSPLTSPPVRYGRIEKEEVELKFVRDPVTAAEVINRRLQFLSLGSFRQEFQVPLPPVLSQIELGELVGITHSMGLAAGGYVNEEVKIVGINVDLDNLLCTLRTIRRVPQVISIPSPP